MQNPFQYIRFASLPVIMTKKMMLMVREELPSNVDVVVAICLAVFGPRETGFPPHQRRLSIFAINSPSVLSPPPPSPPPHCCYCSVLVRLLPQAVQR